MVAEQAKQFDRVAISAPNRWSLLQSRSILWRSRSASGPSRSAKFEQALAEVTGQRVRVRVRAVGRRAGGRDATEPRRRGRLAAAAAAWRSSKHPMIRRAGELFGAQPIRVDDPPDKTSSSECRSETRQPR